jgi:hypothetical protein
VCEREREKERTTRIDVLIVSCVREEFDLIDKEGEDELDRLS